MFSLLDASDHMATKYCCGPLDGEHASSLKPLAACPVLDPVLGRPQGAVHKVTSDLVNGGHHSFPAGALPQSLFHPRGHLQAGSGAMQHSSAMRCLETAIPAGWCCCTMRQSCGLRWPPCMECSCTPCYLHAWLLLLAHGPALMSTQHTHYSVNTGTQGAGMCMETSLQACFGARRWQRGWWW
jgi:hypothetical protein